MAQESWKDSEETGVQTPDVPILCVNNCGFFGSAMTKNMCSQCYRDYIKATTVAPMVEKKVVVAASSSTTFEPAKPDAVSATGVDEKQVAAEEPAKPPTNRCLSCRKKVGLMGFKCRCGGAFCSTHRYADSHECTFDYKKAGREQISKQNPLVMAEKITKI